MMQLLRFGALVGCVIALLGMAPKVQASNLVEAIKGYPEFSAFSRALAATRYGETLANGGPYTVFAFTNEAFARLPDSFEEFLFTGSGKQKLEQIMAYHVIPGRSPSSEMFGRIYEVSTLDGHTLTIEGQLDFIRVNGSTVLRPDLPAENGIIHLLDYVIIPPHF